MPVPTPRRPTLVAVSLPLLLLMLLLAPATTTSSAQDADPTAARPYIFVKRLLTPEYSNGVAVNGRGEVFALTEGYGDQPKVTRYNSEGRRTGGFTFDVGNGDAGSIAVGPDNRLYITESNLYSEIHVFTRSGRKVRTITDEDSARSFGDITVDGQGNMYVADYVNDVIRKLSLSGQELLVFGGTGVGNGKFDLPSGIVLHQGRLYVSDLQNDRVQVFTTGGRFLRKWGQTGTGGGRLSLPVGIAAHGKRVFVLDFTTRVQVYNLRGKYLGNAGDKRLYETTDVALNGRGHLFVGGRIATKSINHGIAKYQPRRG